MKNAAKCFALCAVEILKCMQKARFFRLDTSGGMPTPSAQAIAGPSGYQVLDDREKAVLD